MRRNSFLCFNLPLLFSVFLISNLVHAQRQPDIYMGMSAGGSYAVGNVRHKMLASPGQSVHAFNLGYAFRSGWGVAVGLMGGYNKSKMPKNVLVNGAYQLVPYDWTIVYMCPILLGPMYTFRLGDRWALDLKVRIGLFSTKEIYTRNNRGGQTSAVAFGYSTNITLRYHISSRWSAMVHGDFASCKYRSLLAPGTLSVLNADIGLALRLKPKKKETED